MFGLSNNLSVTNTLRNVAKERVKILLADDRKEDLLSLEVILADEGYEFIKVQSGRDALRILLKEKDFALFLIDVNMPLLDGFETANLIRQNEKLKQIPIIFLTANTDLSSDIFKGYKVGAVDYIIKPVVPEILRTKVSVFVDLYRKTLELQSQKQDLVALNSELAQRSEELTRSNKELEKFAYVASHDMQEPLRTIISYIQLIQGKLGDDLDEDVAKYMDFVTGAGYRMRDLITGLLEYSKINKFDKPLEHVDCNSVLGEVLENLNGGISDNKTIVTVEPLPVVNADYIQMVQLFQNLIGNAIKFKGTEPSHVKINCKKIDGYNLFAVEDNGIGMEQKYVDKIFEIFQRLHPIGEYSGMGIGLAICKKIVERYKGRIWVESLPNKGSTFYFTISDN